MTAPSAVVRFFLDNERRMQDAANRLRIERLAGVAAHLSASNLHRYVSPLHDHLRVSELGAAVAAAGASKPNVASISEAARWHSSALGDTHHLRRMGELMAHIHAGAFGAMPSNWSERLGGLGRLMGDQPGILEVARASGAFAEAERLARFAPPYVLPPGLAAYGLAGMPLAERLAAGITVNPSLALNPGMMSAFAGASAMFDLLRETSGVNREVLQAMRGFAGMAMPPGMSVSQSSVLLDAAGLSLPFSRVPGLLEHAFLRFRPPPTRAEREARLRALKKSAAPQAHQVRAYRRVHDTERLLRRFIDKAMTDLYGPDWARERLPQCGCKDLLGKAAKRGGTVLENADWPHYERIMSNPRHFADVFSYGFDDVDVLREALTATAPFRHAIMHFREFTPENFKALRVALAVLEEGLADMLTFFPVEDEVDDEWEAVDD